MPLICFVDGVTFDPASGELRRGGEVSRLEPQPAALLALLVARAGTLVSHAEIAGHLWPDGTHVDFQAGVHYAVRRIRAALGDQAGAPRFVETMPRRGYRLRVEALAGAPLAPPMAAATHSRARRAVAVSPDRRGARRGGRGRRTPPNDHHARAVALLTAVHDLVY